MVAPVVTAAEGEGAATFEALLGVGSGVPFRLGPEPANEGRRGALEVGKVSAILRCAAFNTRLDANTPRLSISSASQQLGRRASLMPVVKAFPTLLAPVSVSWDTTGPLRRHATPSRKRTVSGPGPERVKKRKACVVRLKDGFLRPEL